MVSQNSGITPFGHGEWAINADINIENIFNQYNGLGQTIVISDSGIDLDHPDLENTDPINSKNYLDETTNDPTPTSDSDTHGTFVMGVVGATTNNDIAWLVSRPKQILLGISSLEHQIPPPIFLIKWNQLSLVLLTSLMDIQIAKLLEALFSPMKLITH